MSQVLILLLALILLGVVDGPAAVYEEVRIIRGALLVFSLFFGSMVLLGWVDTHPIFAPR